MEYKDYNELSDSLRELAHIVDGFDKADYDLGWCFVLGAVTAMQGRVQQNVDNIEETE